uniref:Uncharacterized protein n=1 Tax=Arundo donax TaxID=35708 RepID=A0A0A9BBX0_ARUDO
MSSPDCPRGGSRMPAWRLSARELAGVQARRRRWLSAHELDREHTTVMGC